MTLQFICVSLLSSSGNPEHNWDGQWWKKEEAARHIWFHYSERKACWINTQLIIRCVFICFLWTLSNNFKHQTYEGSKSHLCFQRAGDCAASVFHSFAFFEVRMKFQHFLFKIIYACFVVCCLFFYHAKGPKGEKGDPGPQVRLGGFNSFQETYVKCSTY